MCECMTKPIREEYSGCLVEEPSCKYAERFGFTYMCHHPQHKDFFLSNSPDKQHLDAASIYKGLKESRRNEYIALAKKCLENLENGCQVSS